VIPRKKGWIIREKIGATMEEKSRKGKKN